MQKPASQIVLKPSPKAIKTTPKIEQTEKQTNTAEIHSKETSPTLVEFQSTETQLPEWRLQLKNAVLKRKGEVETTTIGESTSSTLALAPETTYPISGGNALKAEVFEEKRPSEYSNAQLANALKRIEQSRKKFYVVDEKEIVEEFSNEIIETEKQIKEFPFSIASRTENPIVEEEEESKTSVNFPIKTKPTLVPEPKVEKKHKDLYNTSELDPEFISAKISSSFEKLPEAKSTSKTSSEITTNTKTNKETAIQTNELDDIAPFSMRFNSGLFDIIIGSFASLILLSPFMLLGGNWFTIAGFFAFLATCSIVMFIYMTTTVGMFGKTFGMHLFTLEMIDYFEDEYPTFHQAAVSSSIYLLSLAFGGIGFITSIFDEDRRAAHDMISGTIVVKEI